MRLSDFFAARAAIAGDMHYRQLRQNYARFATRLYAHLHAEIRALGANSAADRRR